MKRTHFLAFTALVVVLSGGVAFVTARLATGPVPECVPRGHSELLETFRFLEDFRLCTADGHFLKLRLAFGFWDEPGISAELSRRYPELQDRINFLLMGKQSYELRGVENLEKAKLEILTEVNQVLVSGKIEAVYFIEILVVKDR